MQHQKQKRWFPKPGDLVAVPRLSHIIKQSTLLPSYIKATSNVVYGLVVQETAPSDFGGVWWDILFLGNVESLNIQIITPLWDTDGKCLRS
jgi:hypothetical protein